MIDAGPAVALFTVASGGIGCALVPAFEAAGWRVVSIDLQHMAREVLLVLDIGACTDPDDADHKHVVAALRQATGGRLQALVANAAHQVVRPCDSLTSTDWRTTLAVNLLSPFWLAMAFKHELAANRGLILAISSIHERLTKPGRVAYATSKAALSGMVRAMAVELGREVRCNAICPAAVATPMLMAGFAGRPDAVNALERYQPVGRLGRPEEVAQAALFACSDEAGFLNGACLDVSGGVGARLHDPV